MWKAAWAGVTINVEEQQHCKSDVGFREQAEGKCCAQTERLQRGIFSDLEL